MSPANPCFFRLFSWSGPFARRDIARMGKHTADLLPGMAQVWDECETHKALWYGEEGGGATQTCKLQTCPEGHQILPCLSLRRAESLLLNEGRLVQRVSNSCPQIVRHPAFQPATARACASIHQVPEPLRSRASLEVLRVSALWPRPSARHNATSWSLAWRPPRERVKIAFIPVCMGLAAY